MNGYLDPAGFTRAPEAPNGTSLADQDFGNSGVGFLRGPGQHNFDMAVERIIPLDRIQLSAIPHRVLQPDQHSTVRKSEHKLWGMGIPRSPTQLPVPRSGASPTTVTAPRIIQFAMRYAF